MRRLRAGIVVVGVIIAGGVVWAQTQGDVRCPTTVVLGEVSYTPAEASEEITSGDDLGTGEERGCGWKGPYTEEIALYSIPGVDPRLAVASAVSAHTVYLALG